MVVINHNKNNSKEEYNKAMALSQSSGVDYNIKRNRLLERVKTWEKRLNPSFRNINVESSFVSRTQGMLTKGPARLVLSSPEIYDSKYRAFKIAKSMIILGLSNKDVFILDMNYFVNGILTWEDKSKIYKDLVNENPRLLILLNVSKFKNIDKKDTFSDMIWTQIKSMLVDNIDLSVLITLDNSVKGREFDMSNSSYAKTNNILDKNLESVLKNFNFKKIELDNNKKHTTSNKNTTSVPKELLEATRNLLD